MPFHAHEMLFLSTNGPLNFVMPKYMKFRLSLILRLNAIFTLARHVQLKIMPIPSFKTKCYQILVSKAVLGKSTSFILDIHNMVNWQRSKQDSHWLMCQLIDVT